MYRIITYMHVQIIYVACIYNMKEQTKGMRENYFKKVRMTRFVLLFMGLKIGFDMQIPNVRKNPPTPQA